ncbi:MAG: Acb2/Tad1 domain-containing protein [Blastomonas fulva]|uniref:Acb2/Tad1 domain-containing protein n=1 Tax=Blastomonas fulva TaxID=1550728 RepID=UPI004033365A
MENQHKKITGYRDLTEAEIALMNEAIELEAKFNGLIDRLKWTDGIDQRQVAIAQTEGESAFMRAVRSIAQPTRISA